MTSVAEATALDERLHGTAIGPDDPSYESVRRIHNQSCQSMPSLIARCADAADVIAAVRFARDEGLELAVRAGGHSVAGFSSVDGGVVIDLTHLRHVQVDPVARIARVGGGATAGDLDHATHAFGLATPTATVSSVGVAGFTLAGGIGHLTRACGLALDNLIGADVVLADGTFVRTSEDRERDLLWALRGGGGNFGVVTELRLRLHPVQIVTGGPMFWDLDDAGTILDLYRQWMPEQPDDISAFLALVTLPDAEAFPPALRRRPVCALVWCNTAPAERSRSALDAFRTAVAPPLLDAVAELPYPALQSAFDDSAAAGTHHHAAGLLFKQVPAASGSTFARFGAAMPTPLCQTHLYPVDGAAARVAPADTAWPWRDARFAQMFVGVAPGPGHDAALREWAEGFADALRPGALAGGYANFMMGDGTDRAAYGTNLDRLRTLKARFDPGNVFRRNVNVTP